MIIRNWNTTSNRAGGVTMKNKLPFCLTILLLTGCNGENAVSNNSISNPHDSFLTDENGFRYKEEWLTKENAFEEKISEHDHEEIGMSGKYLGRTRIKVQADPSSSLPADIIYGTSFDQDYPQLRGKEIILRASFTLVGKDNQERIQTEYDIASLPRFEFNSYASFGVCFLSRDTRYIIFNTFGHVPVDFSLFKDQISSTESSSLHISSYALVNDSFPTNDARRYQASTVDNNAIYFLFDKNGKLVFSEKPFSL